MTVTVLDTLITDRVQDDVDAARELFRRGLDRMTSAEKEAVKSGLKGSYGPTDMNRVRVMETRPLSKDKRWRVVEIIEKAK